MNVGVIGGSGFIGSHIVDKLVAQGHEVTVLDMMKPHRPDVGHMHIDITDHARCVIPLAGGYDAVYLLAAVANVNDVAKIPVETGQVNIMGVANVLEAARRLDIKRVILSSTVWVYEAAREQNVDENTPLAIDKVNHVYTASKIAAEMYCQSYQKLYGMLFTILRYGIPYGPRARRGTVLETFVRRALAKQPLVIQGDGLQYRKFVYVEDLADGNVAALQPQAANQTYNLEGNQAVTIKEIAETVRKYIGKVEIKYEAARPGNYEGKNVSNQKAKRELGWEPKTSFDEGVRKFIEWFKATAKA